MTKLQIRVRLVVDILLITMKLKKKPNLVYRSKQKHSNKKKIDFSFIKLVTVSSMMLSRCTASAISSVLNAKILVWLWLCISRGKCLYPKHCILLQFVSGGKKTQFVHLGSEDWNWMECIVISLRGETCRLAGEKKPQRKRAGACEWMYGDTWWICPAYTGDYSRTIWHKHMRPLNRSSI